MKAIVQKALAKREAEVTAAPTLASLLQAKGSRNLSRDVENWLNDHDLIHLLENLVVHLLRRLPSDEIDEMDRWIDTQKLSHAKSQAAITANTLTQRTPILKYGAMTVENALWMERPVMLRTLPRKSGLKGVEAKQHSYQVSCRAAIAPLLPPLNHDNVLPTFGYSIDEESIITVHPQLQQPTLLAELQNRQASRKHFFIGDVIDIGRDMLNGLSYLHTLGFLHRNLCCRSLFNMGSSVEPAYAIGDFTYMVRSSRGRVVAPTWMPRIPAPETLHSRVFEAATDIYGFGVCLLELLFYGDSIDTLPRECPKNIPLVLWDRIVSPCLHIAADSRPTIHELLTELAALGKHADSTLQIPLRDEAVVSCELFSQLVSHGMPSDMTVCEEVVVESISKELWSHLQQLLERNTNLRKLHLSRCPILEGEVRRFEIRHLTHLSLTHMGNTSQLLDVLEVEGMDQLLMLDLSGNPFDDVSMARLLHILHLRSPLIVSLKLQHCSLNYRAMQALADVQTNPLQKLQHLSELHLGGNDGGYHVISTLCTWLTVDPVVKVLDLSHTSLEYFSTTSLAQLIRSSVGIQEIVLKSVELSPPALRMIHEALLAQRQRDDARFSHTRVIIDTNLDESEYAKKIRSLCEK